MGQQSETVRPSLRERNKQDKLRRIRDAARALFLEKGYAATTTREVAERAQIGTGTLFLYARDKEELVFLLFQEEVPQVIEAAFAALPDGPLVDRVMSVFSAFFQHYRLRPELSRLFVKELIFLTGEKQGEHARLTLDFFSRISALLEQAAQRGEVRGDVPAMMAAHGFFAAYLYHLMIWLSLGGEDPAASLLSLRAALSLQVEGLRPGT